jgi:CheY-like chemotaxis protein
MREAERYESSLPRSQKRVVLVVDDQRDLADSVARLVEALGHEALSAYDVPTALALAREFRPQIVVTDVSMPDNTGISLASCVRSDPRLARCRLVALSGYSQELFGSGAADAFDDWIVKPISVEALRKVIFRSPYTPHES